MAMKNPALAATSGGAILGERDATEYRNKPAELQGLRGPNAGSIACRVALLPEIIEALQQGEVQARARGLL